MPEDNKGGVQPRVSLIAVSPESERHAEKLAEVRAAPTVASSSDADPAPEGFLFIDEAVEQVVSRLRSPQGPATQLLLKEMAAGNIRVRKKSGPTWFEPHRQFWADAHLDLDAFRDSKLERPGGYAGIVFMGEELHLHRFLLAIDDFEDWLNRTVKAKADAGKVAATPESSRRLLNDIANNQINAGTLQTEHLAVAANPDSVAAKSRGGAPPKHDWATFIKEIVRFANLDGFTTRKELTAHMRDWCAAEMGDKSPDPETIRRKVIEYCPPETPAE